MDYILRVEEERRKLAVPEETTYHSFVHRLPREVRVVLESARVARSMINPYQQFGWENVVCYARD